MANLYSRKTYDNATLLKAAGLIAASANGSLVLDLGDALMEADLVIDVTAMEVATGDELYTVQYQGSNVANFGSGVADLGSKQLGNVASGAESGLGRYILPTRNELNGTTYRYVRLAFVVAGTIASGINLSAFLAKRDN